MHKQQSHSSENQTTDLEVFFHNAYVSFQVQFAVDMNAGELTTLYENVSTDAGRIKLFSLKLRCVNNICNQRSSI